MGALRQEKCAAQVNTRVSINMTGGDAVLDLSTMHGVVFAEPQVAAVGLSESAQQAEGLS